jgi:hypothetical protein
MELSTPRQWPGSSRSTAGSDRAVTWQRRGRDEAGAVKCVEDAVLGLPGPQFGHPTLSVAVATTHPPGLSLSSLACMSWAYTGGLTTCR